MMKEQNENDFSAELFFDLLSSSTDSYLYMWDIKKGTFKISENAYHDLEIDKRIETDMVSIWSKVIYPADLSSWLQDIELVDRGLKDYHDMEYRVLNRANEIIWVSCRGRVQRDGDGNPIMMVGRISNIGKQNKFDNVTGLKNRNEFGNQCQHLIEQGPMVHGAMVVIDVDNFKDINERYGHAFGNRVLHTIASIISNQLSKDCQLYRLDGDEFAFVISNVDRIFISNIFEEIQLMVSNQMQIDDRHLFITLSAGACLFPKDDDNYQDLSRHAESALEIAKINGKNQMTFFSREIHDRKLKIIELQESLHACVARGFDEFELYYQPQVDVQTHEVVGAEALLRWHSAKFGEVSPVEFIPLLEESNLIIQVGNWVLEKAMDQCDKWQSFKKDFMMSINVSYIQLKENALLKFLAEGIDQKHLSAKNCILELTENCWAPDLNFLNQEFQSIQIMGYGIAIDDFGTGYSSLNHLKELPVDVIKIDRSFIQDIEDHSYEYAFLEYIIKLAHIVNLKVCVEGVETEKEFSIVKKTNPDYIQGFYFGRPVNADQFVALHWKDQ